MLEAELLILANVSLRVGIIVFVELHYRDAFIAIVSHLLLKVLVVKYLDCGLNWVVSTFCADAAEEDCESEDQSLFH